jgi:hypothetical protein
VSGKLTPEIFINKASSNSRLTAVGRQATAADTILTAVSILFFFLFFSLPLMRKQLNYTCMLKNLLKLYCIWTWDTWWGFCVCVCVVLFYFMRPLWWDNNRTTTEASSPGLETETGTQIIKTKTSLHLNLEVVWSFGFLKNFLFFILFYFIFIYTYFFHLLIFYFYSYLYFS